MEIFISSYVNIHSELLQKIFEKNTKNTVHKIIDKHILKSILQFICAM